MSYVNDTIQAIPFENIIGGPLKAAIEAQTIAARATVDFIQQVGFKTIDSGGSEESNPQKVPPAKQDFGEVRNVVFKYVATNDDGTERIAELSVPILTIVPVPYLRIDDMTIDFTANITEMINKTSSLSVNTNTDSGLNVIVPFYGAQSAGIKAKIAKTRNSSSSSKYATEYTMGVHLNAVQDEMPSGLAKVLGILEESIHQKTAVGVGIATSVTITVKDNETAVTTGISGILIGFSNEPVEITASGIVFENVPYGSYTIQTVYNNQIIQQAVYVAQDAATAEVVYNPAS
ncbi:MAG: DUF2589 domain-containing protein [Bacteroidales bacterium]|nr:DUF2589 domain-containing protein [Bacteroidales bacterium]